MADFPSNVKCSALFKEIADGLKEDPAAAKTIKAIILYVITDGKTEVARFSGSLVWLFSYFFSSRLQVWHPQRLPWRCERRSCSPSHCDRLRWRFLRYWNRKDKRPEGLYGRKAESKGKCYAPPKDANRIGEEAKGQIIKKSSNKWFIIVQEYVKRMFFFVYI